MDGDLSCVIFNPFSFFQPFLKSWETLGDQWNIERFQLVYLHNFIMQWMQYSSLSHRVYLSHMVS